MKGIGKMNKSMAKEITNMQMAGFMKVTGKKESNMDTEF